MKTPSVVTQTRDNIIRLHVQESLINFVQGREHRLKKVKHIHENVP
jgi:hypothetical protein